MDTVEAIIICKENIQPLKQGRRADLLGLALQAENDQGAHDRLLKERDEFETLIRMYDGPDPLEPRYRYVQWIEQSYPKHGPDSNLLPLLEDTISTFKDDIRYSQDIRFIELIVKFIDTQVNPLELFQAVHNLGIGSKCALFYRAWAGELDQGGDLKLADKIFRLGLESGAEPRDSLERDHKQFQLSVGRRLLTGEANETEGPSHEATSQRQVLGKLRSAGSSRPSHGTAGVLPRCLTTGGANLPRTHSRRSNVPVSVYVDTENAEPTIPGAQPSKSQHLPKSDLAKKENSFNPGPWNTAYRSAGPFHPRHYTPSTPNFKVHEDEPDQANRDTPMSVCPGALKPKKAADIFHCPIALFEAPDPNLVPMYCKSKVYAGGREFQLEEVMAAMFYKRRRDKLQEQEMEKLGLDPSLFVTPAAKRNISSATPAKNNYLASYMTPARNTTNPAFFMTPVPTKTDPSCFMTPAGGSMKEVSYSMTPAESCIKKDPPLATPRSEVKDVLLQAQGIEKLGLDSSLFVTPAAKRNISSATPAKSNYLASCTIPARINSNNPSSFMTPVPAKSDPSSFMTSAGGSAKESSCSMTLAESCIKKDPPLATGSAQVKYAIPSSSSLHSDPCNSDETCSDATNSKNNQEESPPTSQMASNFKKCLNFYVYCDDDKA